MSHSRFTLTRDRSKLHDGRLQSLPPKIPRRTKILEKDTVLKMPPRERVRYYEKVILDILIANAHGASASELAQATKFAERTVRNHLDILIARGEIHAVMRGRLSLYFARGIIQGEKVTVKSKTKPGLQYVITNLENSEGSFYYIQQKETDEYRALRVKGAIMIAREDGRHFIQQFHAHMAR